MKTPRKKNPPVAWSTDWEVGVRVWVERHGRAVLGEGRADLLAAIDRTHSISAAARLLGISYRHAWKLVQEVNSAAGELLVEAAVGGQKGGGTRLTARGRRSLAIFEQLRDAVLRSAVGLLQKTLAPSPDTAPAIHLAAAISLQEVIGQLLTEYALRQPGVRVRAVYGASNELADHIAAGAPCDLFISADRAHLARLSGDGLLADQPPIVLAANALAAIAPKNQTRSIRTLRGLLAARVRTFALADPACPLGRLSQDYLAQAGCLEPLAAKAVYVDNSRAVLAAIHSGRAEAGLAFASDAAQNSELRTLFLVDPAIASLSYWAGLVRTTRPDFEARSLLEFLSTPLARRCFGRCGLAPPPKPSRSTAANAMTGVD